MANVMKWELLKSGDNLCKVTNCLKSVSCLPLKPVLYYRGYFSERMIR